MDFLPEYILPLTQNPTLQTLITTPPTTHLTNLRAEYLDPYIIQPVSSLLASSTPDLVSVLLLAIILLISLKILDYARRIIMFWVTLAVRVVFWGSVLGAAWWVYRVGVETAGKDLGWVFGIVQGFVEGFQQNGGSGSAGQQQQGSVYGGAGSKGW